MAVPGRIALLGLWLLGAIAAVPSGFGLLWFVPYASVGALLVIRRPRMTIGWILAVLAGCFAFVTVTLDATVQEFADGSITPTTALIAIVVDKSGIVAFVLFALLAIVFPSGRLPTGRWGTAARVALAGGFLLVAATVVMPTIKASLVGYPESVPVRNPLAVMPDLAIWRVISPDTMTFLPIMLLLVAAAISLVVRARRAVGIERQQLHWFTAAIGAVVAAVIAGLAMSLLAPGLALAGVVWIPAIAAFPLVPVAIGIAILRYRLFEIDRIISRTIGWTLVTGVLLTVFAGAVIALQAALAGFTQGQTLAVAASTLVAFALFQPVRRRVQTAVDRRFDRSRYDGERVIAAFSERLRHELDLQTLAVEVDRVATETVRPTKATVWLRTPSRDPSRRTTP